MVGILKSLKFGVRTRPSSTCTSSSNPYPIPCMTPPLICPWCPMGFSTVPTSCAVVNRSSFTSPVSGSTDTSAICAVNPVTGACSVFL